MYLGTFDTEEAAAREYSTKFFEYKGGIYLCGPGTWLAKVIYKGTTDELGEFTTLESATDALSAATAQAKRAYRNQQAKNARAATDPRSVSIAHAKRQKRNRTRTARGSQYRGVNQNGIRWRARLLGKLVGTYGNEIDAAYGYDDAARKHYGEDAVVNFLAEGTPTTQEARARQPPRTRFDFSAAERWSDDHE
jgi:hypothetical protein